MADDEHSAGNCGERSIPDELTPGLDLFVAAWLQEWSEAGGSVHLDGNGNTTVGYLEYSWSPSFVEADASLPECIRNEQSTFRSAMYSGKMRSSLDLLEAVPFGRLALKRHMLSHGMRHYFAPSARALA